MIPKTQLGKWSIGLIIALFLSLGLFVLLITISGLVGKGDDTFDLSDPLTIITLLPLLAAGSAGVAAFFTGITSIWRDKERSILVFAATAIGFYVLFFAVGETLSMVGILPQH
ncbi:MAG: hypothetical protein A2Z11_04860 [Candidatus Woykebacteria bacterium RBG_16_43_9]|uniref:Uncharacterized protein n=1 Tax=Candidatus Woykebacteria bacterium RBG_16_43_9 TaxID=1802596 RepID=A0A1G1WCC9_9BACT|nr:MAG: hypothetical protein A2Z11_04860 [Candidatus Woykebacteria bacterium RBG_16_43_9]